MMAGMPTFEHSLTKRADYEEYGPSIMRRLSPMQ